MARVMLAFGKAVATRLEQHLCPSCREPTVPIKDARRWRSQHRFGRRGLVEAIEIMKRISTHDKKKFGFIFAKMLDLPNPPEDPPNGNFVVKLLDFDIQRKSPLLREISAVKTAVKQVKDLSELGTGPSMDVIDDGLPSVIKDGLSEEEAKEIVAKIESVGGVVVMEPME